MSTNAEGFHFPIRPANPEVLWPLLSSYSAKRSGRIGLLPTEKPGNFLNHPSGLDAQPLWEGGCPGGAFRGGFSGGEIRRLRKLGREGFPERPSRS